MKLVGVGDEESINCFICEIFSYSVVGREGALEEEGTTSDMTERNNT